MSHRTHNCFPQTPGAYPEQLWRCGVCWAEWIWNATKNKWERFRRMAMGTYE